MICHSTVQSLGCNVTTSSQSVHEADGSSSMQVVGESRLLFLRDRKECIFEGLVVENLDVDMLAGTSFMEKNDIVVRPAKRQVILGDGSTYTYGSMNPVNPTTAARRATVLRAPPKSTTVWPGEFIELELPPDATCALERPVDATCAKIVTTSELWPALDNVTSVLVV